MKQVCINCGRHSAGGNLWCTESNCAAELKPMVLEYGEHLADLTIKKELTILHTSTIYEATQGVQGEQKEILLKIAHNGYEERLKRESRFLAKLQTSGRLSPNLPTLLPSFPDANLNEYPYGKTMIRDTSYYYAIYAHEDGEVLRGSLLKNPQPWFQQVGSIMLRLTDAVEVMHMNGRLHLALNPDMVLVRYGKSRRKKQVVVVKLLDLGTVVKREDVRPEIVQQASRASYIAPEFFIEGRTKYGRRTDVYGLGLMLYEMFAGQPAYPFELKSDAQVRHTIKRSLARGGTGIVPLQRPDLDGQLITLVNRTVQRYEERPETPRQLGQYLLDHFPAVAEEKPEQKFNWNMLWIIITFIAIIILILILAMASAT